MELEDIKKQLTSMNVSLNKITDVLVGNEHDKESGFLCRVKELELSVDKLEKFKDRIMYITVGMSVPSTYGIYKFLSVIFNLAAK